MPNTFCLFAQRYERELNKMRKMGVEGMKIEKLLGDPRRVTDTSEFIERTGRFDF